MRIHLVLERVLSEAGRETLRAESAFEDEGRAHERAINLSKNGRPAIVQKNVELRR